MNPQQMIKEVDETMEEILERDRLEEKRIEDLECRDECKEEKPDWDMDNGDYL